MTKQDNSGRQSVLLRSGVEVLQPTPTGLNGPILNERLEYVETRTVKARTTTSKSTRCFGSTKVNCLLAYINAQLREEAIA